MPNTGTVLKNRSPKHTVFHLRMKVTRKERQPARTCRWARPFSLLPFSGLPWAWHACKGARVTSLSTSTGDGSPPTPASNAIWHSVATVWKAGIFRTAKWCSDSSLHFVFLSGRCKKKARGSYNVLRLGWGGRRTAQSRVSSAARISFVTVLLNHTRVVTDIIHRRSSNSQLVGSTIDTHAIEQKTSRMALTTSSTTVVN